MMPAMQKHRANRHRSDQPAGRQKPRQCARLGDAGLDRAVLLVIGQVEPPEDLRLAQTAGNLKEELGLPDLPVADHPDADDGCAVGGFEVQFLVQLALDAAEAVELAWGAGVTRFQGAAKGVQVVCVEDDLLFRRPYNR